MSNKATNNKKEKESTDRITTALHLVLGGFARVLGSAVLMGASATSPTAGKLLLELTACPSDAQIAEALDLANDAVRRDLAVRTAALDRAAADARNAAGHVNGTALYGARAPPANFSRIDTVEIADWCLAVSGGPHVASSAAVGAVRAVKHDFVADRKRFSIFLEIDSIFATAASAGASAAPTTAPVAAASRGNRFDDSMHVPKTALRLLDSVLPAIDGDAARSAARAAALKSFESELFQFKNAAYTAGFLSATPNKQQ
jgi:alanyl-tRNA synthetase